jgi:hypothetical protein
MDLTNAQHRKETGKGRRSTRQEIRQLQKREGLNDDAYQKALGWLTQASVAAYEGPRPTTGAELLSNGVAERHDSAHKVYDNKATSNQEDTNAE